MKLCTLAVVGGSLLACMMLISCGGAGESMGSILDKKGLERNNLDNWERRSYPKLGISIEMPKDIEFVRDIYRDPNDIGYGYNNLMFSMHPQYYGYVEPHYVVSFFIEILNKGQYERFINGGHCIRGDPFFKDSSFLDTLKEDIKNEYSQTNKHYYRRDYRNDANGDVALAAAVYWETIDPDPQHKELDLVAIRRILNSIQFIPKEQK